MDRVRRDGLERITQMIWIIQEKESGYYLSVPLMNSVPKEYIEMTSDQLLKEIKTEVESLLSGNEIPGYYELPRHSHSM